MPCMGHVIRGTPIAVDLWQRDQCPQVHLFFLSHFHSDHTVGFKDTWDFPIYTSHVTGQLLINITGVKPSLVKCLELEETYLLPLDHENREMLSVTLYDANHCPGSVSFLFQGYFGNVFYTGDFRYKPDFVEHPLPSIDILYLDNTYCSPKCQFPKRDVAVDYLLQRVHTCLRHSKRVYLGLDNLGKEELLGRISKETHTKICVTPERQKILEIVGTPRDILTCDKKQAKIVVVPGNQISSFKIEKLNLETPTCAILATAKYTGYNFQPYAHNNRIHLIQLSNHSSYEELVKFVQHVGPRTIIPIIGKDCRGVFNTDISERADMGQFSSFLNPSPPNDFTIPRSVENAMSLWIDDRQPTTSAKRSRTSDPGDRRQASTTRRGIEFLDSPVQSEEDFNSDSSEQCDEPPSRAGELSESNESNESYSLLSNVRESSTATRGDSFGWNVTHVSSQSR